MWAIIPWLRVARTIATFGWLFSACCLLLVRLTMLELPLNFPTMSLWMVLKPPSRHSDFPRDFSNPNEFLFRWRMHADMWPQTWRHKASDMFDSKVCSAGELFESFFADEASLTFAPTESWQSSGASHIWCSSCCTSWGCAIDLGRQTAQTVPKSDDLWWFCRKSFCLRRFFQNKKMFQLLMVDLSLPNPDPNLASGPFELPGSLLFSKTCVCVCVSFWSKNAGINDKNLGPYVSVLQRKWHCTIASKSHHRISQKFHVHGSMPSHAIIWIVHNNANITSGSSEYAHIYPVCLLFLETVSTFQRSGSLWHGQVGNSPFGPGSRQACRQLWRVQQGSPSRSRGEWPFGLQVISLNFESEGFVWRKKALLSEIRIRFFFGQKIWNSSLCRFFVFFFFETPFPIAFEDLLRLSSFEALLGSFVGNGRLRFGPAAERPLRLRRPRGGIFGWWNTVKPVKRQRASALIRGCIEHPFLCSIPRDWGAPTACHRLKWFESSVEHCQNWYK